MRAITDPDLEAEEFFSDEVELVLGVLCWFLPLGGGAWFFLVLFTDDRCCCLKLISANGHLKHF